jgi:hypothetical protein
MSFIFIHTVFNSVTCVIIKSKQLKIFHNKATIFNSFIFVQNLTEYQSFNYSRKPDTITPNFE